MKIDSLKSFLKPYSIYQNRKTTINGSFAAAVVPTAAFDKALAVEAMALLGQASLDKLVCVYCGALAGTWDHLVPKVKQGRPHGPGHQLGNLVPCCKDCNSSKGARDWREFIALKISDSALQADLIERLEQYQASFVQDLDVPYQSNDALLAEYDAVRDQILQLMLKADEIAQSLRRKS